MTDTPAAASRAGAAQSKAPGYHHAKTSGPVLPHRPDVRANQRDLVRASLIARPPAGDTRHDRWP